MTIELQAALELFAQDLLAENEDRQLAYVTEDVNVFWREEDALFHRAQLIRVKGIADPEILEIEFS